MTPRDFFHAYETGLVATLPAWAIDLAEAASAEVAFDLPRAKAALARAELPEAMLCVGELVELRIVVREATTSGLETAIERLEVLIDEVDPDTRARALHLLAVASLRLDRIDRAELALVDAISLEPHAPALIWMMDTLAQILIGQGAWLEAILTLEALVARRAADPIGVAISAGHLARLHLQLGAPDEAAVIARRTLAQLPADAPIPTRLRLQTIVVDAILDAQDHAALPDAERELARLVVLGDERHYLRGYALMTIARARGVAGDPIAATELLQRATTHEMPAPVVLLHEAMIDPAAPERAAWREAWNEIGVHVSEPEIRIHLLLARRADSTERRAHIDRAYRRAMESNNPLWMRWVDEATSQFDPALYAERIAERFTGRSRHDLERTAREHVTIIFIDLVDFTPRTLELSPEQVMSTVRGMFELGVPLLARHHVRPISYLGDGLLAICQGDDHAARGLAFARELVARSGRASRVRHALGIAWPLDLRGGVASGLVVLGTLGTLFKTDFAAIGFTTNLASRLQGAAAPGEVVCTLDVARAANLELPVEHLKLKGMEKRDAVPACRIVVYPLRSLSR